MDIKASTEAVAKTVESKLQDVVANVTGDPADQLSAKVKQPESCNRKCTKSYGRFS